MVMHPAFAVTRLTLQIRHFRNLEGVGGLRQARTNLSGRNLPVLRRDADFTAQAINDLQGGPPGIDHLGRSAHHALQEFVKFHRSTQGLAHLEQDREFGDALLGFFVEQGLTHGARQHQGGQMHHMPFGAGERPLRLVHQQEDAVEEVVISHWKGG